MNESIGLQKACDNLDHDYQIILGIKFCKNCGYYCCKDRKEFDDAIIRVDKYRKARSELLHMLCQDRISGIELSNKEAMILSLFQTFADEFVAITSQKVSLCADIDTNLYVRQNYKALLRFANAVMQLDSIISSGEADRILEKLNSRT